MTRQTTKFIAIYPGLFTEPRLSGGDLRFQGPGRPLPKVLSRIW